MRDNQRSKVYAAEGAAFGVQMRAFTRVSEDIGEPLVLPPGEYPPFGGGGARGTRLEPSGDISWHRYTVRDQPTEWALSLKDCQRFTDRITRSSAWPHTRTSVVVRDGRGRRAACAYGFTIKLPRWARTKTVICHELAHIAGGDKHGTKFARCYIDFVARFVGKDEARALRSAFKDHKVKVARRSHLCS